VVICPVLFAALQSPEWRVKQSALDRLSQLAGTAPDEISKLLPRIIPKVTSQVWDTKPQVTKAATSCLLATCNTNLNPDVKPAIPAIVNAIVKPSDTMTAVDELMGTTFVSTVDSSTLAILCPILSRGLKQKVARDKRSCCVVIENMSRLVDSPKAVAPFGPLLVPDLKKVVENVQFEEMRDIALKALQTLTKALGHASVEEAYNAVMAQECARAEDEQRKIEEQRLRDKQREEQNRIQEEQEKKQWKEAMEAHRLLEQMKEKEEEEKKAEELRKKELSKQSVKTKTGKCQGCGLKKCKKDCLFNS
jgi:elongation factor 3